MTHDEVRASMATLKSNQPQVYGAIKHEGRMEAKMGVVEENQGPASEKIAPSSDEAAAHSTMIEAAKAKGRA